MTIKEALKPTVLKLSLILLMLIGYHWYYYYMLSSMLSSALTTPPAIVGALGGYARLYPSSPLNTFAILWFIGFLVVFYVVAVLIESVYKMVKA